MTLSSAGQRWCHTDLYSFPRGSVSAESHQDEQEGRARPGLGKTGRAPALDLPLNTEGHRCQHS